ncbi:MAG: hypothetical protein IPM64_10280 [Phycisphaerales bacterium]|nr:hypothetical protein [Phycisphaerales bacterium]
MTYEGGVMGTAAGGYAMVNNLTGSTDVSFKPVLPTFDRLASVKIDAQVFAFADVELGTVARSLRANVFGIKGGPKLTMDLASLERRSPIRPMPRT